MEAQEPAYALPAYDRSRLVVAGGRQDELAARALMVSLLVVVRQILVNRGA